MDAGRAADLYDAVVVGGGPAGLAAALYLARARYRVLVVEKDTFGGQITITAEVVNYPGVEKTEGHSLTETMRRQALHFGAEFLLAEAQGIDVDGDFRIVRTSRGAFRCFAVLLATGAHPRKVGFEGEETFRGRGVAYCATCDGGFFTDRDVFVVGGGFAAAEEAMFLTRYARSVTMLVRRSTLSCAESIAEQVLAHESVRVRFNTVLEAVEGDTALRRAVRFADKKHQRSGGRGERGRRVAQGAASAILNPSAPFAQSPQLNHRSSTTAVQPPQASKTRDAFCPLGIFRK